MERVGAIVRRLRGKMPQAALGALVGHHQTWVGDIERGAVACTPAKFALLCDVLAAPEQDRVAGLRDIAEEVGLSLSDMRAIVEVTP